jgi:hypothetical protein
MRIFTGAVLIVTLVSLTLTGCVERQTMDVRPKSGGLVIESTDVLYVTDLLADTAKAYDLEPQKLVSADMIASYEGGKQGTFSGGLVFILLWHYTNPNILELDISGPTPVGASVLSRRIFREVKAKLIGHFGSDRVHDQTKAVLSPP